MRRFINSESIFAISLPKREIASRLEVTTRQLIFHLIKLYLYPDSIYTNHWNNDVYNTLHSVSTIKRSHKLPSKKFILDNTIGLNKRFIPSLIKVIEDDYTDQNGESIEYTLDEIESAMYMYFDWISSVLSRDGYLSRKSVYETLKELRFGN